MKELSKRYDPNHVPSWVAKRVHGVPFKLVQKEWNLYKRDFSRYPEREADHVLIELRKAVVVFKHILCPRVTRSFVSNGLRRIVKLKIPKGALVIAHKSEAKCRADQAVYLGDFEGFSAHSHSFKYRPGALVKPTSRFGVSSESIKNDCGTGIHFCFARSMVRKY